MDLTGAQCSGEHLLDLFDNAPVGLHLQWPDGEIRIANHALANLLGYPRDDLVGKRFFDFFADEDAREVVQRSLADGEVVNSLEVALRSRSGAIQHVLVSASGLWTDGKLIHARCFTRSIPALRRAIDALAEADARKAAILDASLDAIITMDADGRLQDFNRGAERIFGYAREHVLNRKLSELIIPPRLREAHEAGLKRFLATGVGPVLGRRIEIEALRADGREFPVELSIAVVQGTKPMFTATLRDITERLTAEQDLRRTFEALQRSEAALREADHRKDQFIATLAHELRNPLSPVRAAAEILARSGTTPDKVSWAANVIRRQVNVMARLLDDLLDVARVAQGKLSLRKEPVMVADLVQLAVQTAQPLMDAKSQRLEVQEQATSDLRLIADAVRIAQVLTNLLANASKYSDDGQVITLRAFTRDKDLVFEVQDQGIGFSSDAAKSLFQLFSQLPEGSGRAQGGLGVGLALSRSLMNLHGGDLHAHSRGPGLGATFTAILPVAVP